MNFRMPANGKRQTSTWSWPRSRIGLFTPCDRTVLNDLDRFDLVTDAIDRQPQTDEQGICLKQHLKDMQVEAHLRPVNRE